MTPAELGSYVFGAVTATNSVASLSTTASTVGISQSAPIIVTAPSVAGTRITGNELSVSAGSWAMYPASGSTYQWYRCTSTVSAAVTSLPGSCSVVDGATSSTYMQTADDAGKYVTVATSRSNTLGSSTVWSVSTTRSQHPPTFVETPGLSGTKVYGQDSDVTIEMGTWAGYPAPDVTSRLLTCEFENLELADAMPMNCDEAIAHAVAVDIAFGRSCALMSDKSIQCWGRTANSYLASPTHVAGIAGATAIAVGTNHTCAILGTGSVKCWGLNSYGQLGDGTRTDRLTPVDVVGITNATAIEVGRSHTCALLDSGSVKCWGWNIYGEVGIGDLTLYQTNPVLVKGLANVVAISLGDAHSCALLSNGSVKCWGYNNSAQLGNLYKTNQSSPGPVYELSGPKSEILWLSNVISISAGGNSTCALLVNGSVKCWGSGANSWSGNGFADQAKGAVLARTGFPEVLATQLSTGSGGACITTTSNGVLCWGENTKGELGDGSRTWSDVAVQVVGLSDVTSVISGGNHRCAAQNDAGVRCWGRNYSGELGLGYLSQGFYEHEPLVSGRAVGPSWNMNPTNLNRFLVLEIVASNQSGSVSLWTPSVNIAW